MIGGVWQESVEVDILLPSGQWHSSEHIVFTAVHGHVHCESSPGKGGASVGGKIQSNGCRGERSLAERRDWPQQTCYTVNEQGRQVQTEVENMTSHYHTHWFFVSNIPKTIQHNFINSDPVHAA